MVSDCVSRVSIMCWVSWLPLKCTASKWELICSEIFLNGLCPAVNLLKQWEREREREKERDTRTQRQTSGGDGREGESLSPSLLQISIGLSVFGFVANEYKRITIRSLLTIHNIWSGIRWAIMKVILNYLLLPR
jgi:hypothetical protein